MSDKTPHDLSFVSAAALEENLSIALQGLGQKFKHQKLQELAARIQGYPSRNHRVEPALARIGLTFLVADLYCEAGSDMIALDVTYLVFSLTWDDFQKMRRAEAAARMVDPWASISISAGFVDGYGEPDDGLDLDDPGAAATCLESLSRTTGSEDLYIRTTSHAVNITPAMGSKMWLSGAEKHGYGYSSSWIALDKIESAFLTGEFAGSAEWYLLPPTEGELA